MINKKAGTLLKTLSYAVIFSTMISCSSIPARASVNSNEITTAGHNDVGIINGVNNIIEQNGIRITVNEIKAAKNKIDIIMTLESDKQLDNRIFDSIETRVSVNDGLDRRYSSSYTDKGNNTVKICERLEDENGFAEKNMIRIDAVCGFMDLNSSIKIPVDFTEAFKKDYIKEINYKVNDKEVIERLESNGIGTYIAVSKKITDYYDKELFNHGSYMIKIDGKYYISTYPQYLNGDGEKEYNAFEFSGISYEDIAEAENVSIIAFNNTMDDNEIDKFYNDEEYRLYCDEMKEENNISYPENVKFNDGTTGTVKVDRNNGKIKVTVKGESDKHCMLMVSTLNADFADVDNDMYYGEADKICAYKDEDSYIIEFKDTQENHKLNIFMDGMIYNIDRFDECDEIIVK